MQRTISVSAEGSVVTKPDMARISSGVVSEARTAREALTANSAAVQKLIAALKQAGIAAADLQTSSINVQPRYTHHKDGQAPRIDGYTVSNDLSVVVRDLGKLGDILDQLVTLGANQIGGLSFDVANADALRDEARKAAVANARKRAALYAEAAGVTLGDVLEITEGEGQATPRGPMLARAQGRSADFDHVEPEIDFQIVPLGRVHRRGVEETIVAAHVEGSHNRFTVANHRPAK